ncbi:MAG: HAD family hydrolase [Spirochaetes bacterium]|nr:HAD family hydrolase [Spirochaetota bacterium]
MKIQAVLWDKDGTLLDGFADWIRRDRRLVQRLARERSTAPLSTDQLDALDRAALVALGVEEGRVLPHGLLAHGTEEALLLALRGVLSNRVPVEEPPLFLEHARESLRRLLLEEGPVVPHPTPAAGEALVFFSRQRLKQGLATSDSLTHARSEFEALGWEPYFCFWGCGDTAAKPKPDPWTVNEFCRLHGLAPGNVLVIGDAPADMEMARRAGARGFGVLGGVGGRSELAAAERLFSGLDELLGWMRGHLDAMDGAAP